MPASVAISLGLGPVMTLTTDVIVASAPRERAGAAASVSETSGVLGGALGIAIIGSITTAVYRAQVGEAVPDEARDTLGGAAAAAEQLPDQLGAALLGAANEAFTQGVHVAAAISAVLLAATAILLRHVGAESEARAAPADSTGSTEGSSAQIYR